MGIKRLLNVGLATVVFAGLGFAGQDWYHDRDTFYRGDWHPHVFSRVLEDLNHIYTAGAASEKEQRRLERTKEELSGLQAKLDQGVFDNGTVNDVIDSLRKSANDNRLGPQDRQILADDASRIHDFQRNHNRWTRH
jgi:hypothetical protein